MTTQPSTSLAGIDVALPDLRPVAVTRWTAQLVDPQCEQAYRQERFADDRRRLLFLMGVVAAAGLLIFLGRLFSFLYGGGSEAALFPPLVSMSIPLAAALVFRPRRTPQSLEIAVVAICTAGTALRLLMLTLQPALLAMWLPLIVTTLFVVYLYLPVRFTVSVGLAAAFSALGRSGWALIPYGALPARRSGAASYGSCSPTRSALPRPTPCSAASACSTRRAWCCSSCCRPTR